MKNKGGNGETHTHTDDETSDTPTGFDKKIWKSTLKNVWRGWIFFPSVSVLNSIHYFYYTKK